MVAQTCSTASPPVSSLSTSVNVQQPTSTSSQVEHLSVNFVLFDRLNSGKPLYIDVPRSLFEGKSQDCRNLFSDVLLNEFEINTKKTGINFWKPKEHILLDTATKRGWTESINDIEEFCTPIPLPRPFVTALPEVDNVDIVHLVVTVDSLNTLCQTNVDGSSSANHSAPSSAAYEFEYRGPLQVLGRRIHEYILSQSDLVEGPHVSDIARAIADPNTTDARQISTALEHLMDDGLIYNTIDESHFQACD